MQQSSIIEVYHHFMCDTLSCLIFKINLYLYPMTKNNNKYEFPHSKICEIIQDLSYNQNKAEQLIKDGKISSKVYKLFDDLKWELHNYKEPIK